MQVDSLAFKEVQQIHSHFVKAFTHQLSVSRRACFIHNNISFMRLFQSPRPLQLTSEDFSLASPTDDPPSRRLLLLLLL